MRSTLRWGLPLTVLLFVGCAAVIDEPAPEVPPEEKAPVVIEQAPPAQPAHRRSGSALSPAAASLLSSAEGYLRGGQPDRALSLIQRAHRISPDSAEVYYQLARAHQAKQEFPRAEQFALRGVGLAGDQSELEKQGWRLVAEIRQQAGNFGGAQAAQERASGR